MAAAALGAPGVDGGVLRGDVRVEKRLVAV